MIFKYKWNIFYINYIIVYTKHHCVVAAIQKKLDIITISNCSHRTQTPGIPKLISLTLPFVQSSHMFCMMAKNRMACTHTHTHKLLIITIIPL